MNIRITEYAESEGSHSARGGQPLPPHRTAQTRRQLGAAPTALWGTAVPQPHRALSSIRTAQTGLVGPSLYCRPDVSRGHRLRLQPHPYSCH